MGSRRRSFVTPLGCGEDIGEDGVTHANPPQEGMLLRRKMPMKRPDTYIGSNGILIITHDPRKKRRSSSDNRNTSPYLHKTSPLVTQQIHSIAARGPAPQYLCFLLP